MRDALWLQGRSSHRCLPSRLAHSVGPVACATHSASTRHLLLLGPQPFGYGPGRRLFNLSAPVPLEIMQFRARVRSAGLGSADSACGGEAPPHLPCPCTSSCSVLSGAAVSSQCDAHSVLVGNHSIEPVLGLKLLWLRPHCSAVVCLLCIFVCGRLLHGLPHIRCAGSLPGCKLTTVSGVVLALASRCAVSAHRCASTAIHPCCGRLEALWGLALSCLLAPVGCCFGAVALSAMCLRQRRLTLFGQLGVTCCGLWTARGCS
jgi:hypothetical protein